MAECHAFGLAALDGETMPMPVVERVREMLKPGPRRVLRSHRLDLVLEEAADGRAVVL